MVSLAIVLTIVGCRNESANGTGLAGTPTPTVATETGSIPTDTPAPSAAMPTATPAPTPSISYVVESLDPCGPSLYTYSGNLYEHFLHWTADGSHLVISYDDGIATLDIESGRVQKIVDVDPDEHELLYGFYADVSPDGSRVVYATCEYILEEPYVDPIGASQYHTVGYEIAIVNIDGGGRKRLTSSGRFENYPAWSPDGTRIAVITSSDPHGRPTPAHYDESGARIAVISSEDGRGRWTGTSKSVALYPPVWSHDGEYLAFIVNEGDRYRPEFVVISVRIGKEAPVRIGATTALPTWSPDGTELALASMEGAEAVIYAVEPDGTRARLIWRGDLDGASIPISQVSWSPDGSELLVIAGGIYVISLEGNSLHPLLPDNGIARAAWSPGGSRIAVYYPGDDLITLSRDGKDLRVVAESGKFGIRKLKPPVHELSLDPPADCAAGVAVSDPELNPGLVRDCEALIGLRDTLAGSAQLRWDPDTPITEWDGVDVGLDKPRVRSIRLRDHLLNGSIPPELGQLTMLESLYLSNNLLTGEIPSELGRLENLTDLDLSGNLFTGSVPAELSGMTSLESLVIGGNDLSGCIPVDLPDIWVQQSGLERCEAEPSTPIAGP